MFENQSAWKLGAVKLDGAGLVRAGRYTVGIFCVSFAKTSISDHKSREFNPTYQFFGKLGHVTNVRKQANQNVK